MRKGLTFEAAKNLHRRRARTLIFASVAALVLGSTVSAAVAAAWGADRRDSAGGTSRRPCARIGACSP
jgi:uncharacterized membrane protein